MPSRAARQRGRACAPMPRCLTKPTRRRRGRVGGRPGNSPPGSWWPGGRAGGRAGAGGGMEEAGQCAGRAPGAGLGLQHENLSAALELAHTRFRARAWRSCSSSFQPCASQPTRSRAELAREPVFVFRHTISDNPVYSRTHRPFHALRKSRHGDSPHGLRLRIVVQFKGQTYLMHGAGVAVLCRTACGTPSAAGGHRVAAPAGSPWRSRSSQVHCERAGSAGQPEGALLRGTTRLPG
jgi:hypothetical protein